MSRGIICSCLLLSFARLLVPFSHSRLLQKFICFKPGLLGIPKLSHQLSKLCHKPFKVLQSAIGMQSNFCECMPFCCSVQERHDDCIIWLQQQSFKCWNTALKQIQELAFFFFLLDIIDLTCNRSSKSQAVSFFISEAFVAKHQIVPEPNVGMPWKLIVSERLF